MERLITAISFVFFIVLGVLLTFLLMGTSLMMYGCGDGDRDTKTITVNDTGGDVSINDPVEPAPFVDDCMECVGNPFDGITDEECFEFNNC